MRIPRHFPEKILVKSRYTQMTRFISAEKLQGAKGAFVCEEQIMMIGITQ